MTIHIGTKTECFYHDEEPTAETINKGCVGRSPTNDDPYCEVATRLLRLRYPQGWNYYAGDTCRHGVYTGGCGADNMCGACEMGEELRR